MLKNRTLSFTALSLLCVVSAGICGFLWNNEATFFIRRQFEFTLESALKGDSSAISYSEFLDSIGREDEEGLSLKKVFISPGDPVVEVTFGDDSVRKLWMPSESKGNFVMLLNQKNITIMVPEPTLKVL